MTQNNERVSERALSFYIELFIQRSHSKHFTWRVKYRNSHCTDGEGRAPRKVTCLKACSLSVRQLETDRQAKLYIQRAIDILPADMRLEGSNWGARWFQLPSQECGLQPSKFTAPHLGVEGRTLWQKWNVDLHQTEPWLFAWLRRRFLDVCEQCTLPIYSFYKPAFDK